MKSTNLQRVIMRRVYYSYGLSIITSAMFWQGIFLGVSALLLARWLHVASIVHNFLSVPVGSVPKYITGSFIGAINHGEVMTALVLVLAGLISIKMGYQITKILIEKPRLLIKV